jgi:hypothetical protein
MKAQKELSVAELEAMLAEKKKEERAEKAARKAAYETERDELINELCYTSGALSDELSAHKNEAFYKLKIFREKMLEYSDLKGGENNKGNFQIENEHYKIVFSSQVKSGFDERSLLAEEHLKKFLSGFVKKRDRQLYKLIMSLLERNSITGDLDINSINRLYKMENDFDDPDWQEAIRLFKESYNPKATTEYVRFYTRSDNSGWDLINLNFSSI